MKNIKTRLGLVAAALAAVVASVMPTGAASAETTAPAFFQQSGWWDTQYPGKQQYAPTDGTDRWLYPNFPIACNNSTQTNRFRAFWVYPSDVASTYNATFARQIIRAASSGIAASAKRAIGPTVANLKDATAPRWYTASTADGDCVPSITQIAVPRGYLTRTPGTGFWNPYTQSGQGTAGILDDYLDAQGYMPSNTRAVFLMQEWGTPSLTKGVTTSSSNPNPGQTNANNYGGDSVYVKVGDLAPGTNEWGTGAWRLLHEMTHSLGAFVTGSPNENTQNGSGHAADCWEALCYGYKGQAGQTYLSACQGNTEPPELTDYENLRAMNRLDCNGDDYWSINNAATWAWQRWNTYNSAFLWSTPSGIPPAEGPIYTATGSAKVNTAERVIFD